MTVVFLAKHQISVPDADAIVTAHFSASLGRKFQAQVTSPYAGKMVHDCRLAAALRDCSIVILAHPILSHMMCMWEIG